MDQFLENRQNYMMENNSIQQLNVASAGDAVVGGVQSEVVSGVAGEILGGKYDEHHEEHDVGDDDELKYVEEVQQSEKQQQQQLQTLKNVGLDDNELAEKETSNNTVHEFGNGNGDFVFGGNHHNHEQPQNYDLFNIGNGHDTNGHDNANINEEFDTLVSTGFEEKLNLMESELDVLKNEGDISSTSNLTEIAEGIVPKIDVKIETKVEHHEIVDEEEPSSLATNTTNGTSSLSENIPPQVNIDFQANDIVDVITQFEDKENSDPLKQKRPVDLDLEQAQSQLNPDAKVFIPSFGSNPASPTSPFATGALQTDHVFSNIMETEMYFGIVPTVAPRHLIKDDDFLAQSPCKGKDDNSMDSVLLPRALSDFEQGADKCPREIDQEVIERDGVMTPDQAIQQLPLDDVEILGKGNVPAMNSTDFQPSNFMDHGPETCVDQETDLDLQPTTVLPSLQDENDVMKRSMYIVSDDAIEVVLNSVQPIPTDIDSVNNSFIEESITECAAMQLTGDKELLQVEEKEHVSHSPSTEEIQINLQNNLSSSNRDIPQLPVDMQDSLFMKQDQNLLNANEQYDNIRSFELGGMLEDRQQSAQDVEKQLLVDDEPKHDNLITEFENEILIEETNIAKKKYETDEEDIEQSKKDQLSVEDQIDNIYANNLTANTLVGNEHYMEHQQEINESFSPFKVSDELSNTNAFESRNNEIHGNLQQSEISNTHLFESLKESPANLHQNDFVKVDMLPSFTVDEKHLLEETKEQQTSMSEFEPQLNEFVLRNTEDNLSQAEEYKPKTFRSSTEEIWDDILKQQQPEPEQTENLSFDDSLKRHELECEQKQKILAEVEIISDVTMHETHETPAEQQQLQNHMLDAGEPMVDTKQAPTLLTNEETEIKTEENSEIPITAEVLEPTITTHSEIEIEKQSEHQIEEVKTDMVKEPEAVELKDTEVETVKDDIVAAPEIIVGLSTVTVLGATAAELATIAAITGKEDSSPSAKKPLTKTTSASTKSKVASTTAANKHAEPGKKQVGLAAKPRTALAKQTATTTDKKNTTATTTTLANRKPTTTSKVVAKTTTTTSSTRTLTTAPKTATTSKPTTTTSRPTAATRTLPSSTLTARKTTTTNSLLVKPRPGSAPAKPTTLGLPATNGAPKAKPVSPRSTVTSQVRKTASVTTTTKSPTKPAVASSTLASRIKNTTSTASSTAGTTSKTFTARPAPKFISSSSATTTTTTSRRLTAAVSTTSSTATTTLKSSSTPLRKSTPTKPSTTKSPSKSSAGALKSKTPITKTASPDVKPAPIRKPVDKTLAVATNGGENTDKKLNDLTEEQLNSDMQAVQQQNGNSSIPMQTEKGEQPFLKTRDEQIPMDVINA